jgi:hypothetical protein
VPPGLAEDDVPGLLARLASRDVRITVAPGGASLTVDAPAGEGGLSDEEWDVLAAAKPRLLAHLAPAPPAPRFAAGEVVVATYAGIAGPPRPVAGVDPTASSRSRRYVLEGEPFSRAEGELRPATPAERDAHARALERAGAAERRPPDEEEGGLLSRRAGADGETDGAEREGTGEGAR